MRPIVFFDSEIDPESGTILDIGAADIEGKQFHSARIADFSAFMSKYDYIGGHNILACDLVYLAAAITQEKPVHFVDTLCLSPLLFPKKPYHRLLKDDKLQTDTLSNPLDDSIKSMELFIDETAAFDLLDEHLKQIYYTLLHGQKEFEGFFAYSDYSCSVDLSAVIKERFDGLICENAAIEEMAANYPTELAYCLALISADDRYSAMPAWVRINYPYADNCMHLLRSKPCAEGCAYCRKKLDVRLKLKEIFGYDSFRTYNGEPLQENAANAAVHGRSLVAIFPTGGGKSITFQLPALIAGETAKGLTVVISPLQSLMKDQVDNLARLGIADAVTINGLLSPVERADSIERVRSGQASILYISPESLRSKTIERLLLSRNVVRFVIDEAHCFSAWGHDFRVDYLYIGDFIREFCQKKNLNDSIPVSCFTATAKQKVIQDIRDYFMEKLGLELELYATNASRTNLRYAVLYKADDEEKYLTLRMLIEQKDCPTIVYVSRTKRAKELAERLTHDGMPARPYHGKMDSTEKVENQEAFISGEVKIVVATSAFGMGVDKSDVGLVVHYDISDSLENYVQEAGRAGRDPELNADCYVLFNEDDLNKHFIRLNQTKLSQSEIQQVWRAIKRLAARRPYIYRSALEIAREAGWSEEGPELETRVKTAVSALESAGYIRRGQNSPHVYATGIMLKSMAEASERIRSSEKFDEKQEQNALRIIKLLISERSKTKRSDSGESRIDYIADILGLERSDVVEAINLMREDKILADTQDMSAYIKRSDSENKSLALLTRFSKLEQLLLDIITDEPKIINLKEINEMAEANGIKGTSVRSLTTILFYWTARSFIEKSYSRTEKAREIVLRIKRSELVNEYMERIALAAFIVGYLFDKATDQPADKKGETLVQFSVVELLNAYTSQVLITSGRISPTDVQNALLYLSKIGVLTLEGGFLVLYNTMEIQRLEMDNRIQYKQEDYRRFNEFYKQKIQQIHIVGEYANMMVRDYDEALRFVSDYFQMDYKAFLSKYFKGNRAGEINRNITPQKYNELIGSLSESQRSIIDDEESRCIVVAAGPGSGKTKLLVHKLAALVMLDDVKYEQLLMLTFSRAAATEFKDRLYKLLGGAAKFIEIKTFHSYCFDLLGRVGSLEKSDEIVKRAVEMIRSGEAEQIHITKTVTVIDEAQDMDAQEYELICSLMEANTDMRVIAVGDDDQNIFAFRGSDSKYMKAFITEHGAKQYDLLENYRSCPEIVDFADRFVRTIPERMKNRSIRAAGRASGIVGLTHHAGRNLEYPVVNAIEENCGTDKTVCVLTYTNEEALKVLGMLKQRNIPCRLIQSNEGFSLYDLAEMRMFLKLTQKGELQPVISDAQWEQALHDLKKCYGSSECLEMCLDLLGQFASVNEKKYRSDLENFIRESNLSDLCHPAENEVTVSTLHKSKGHEFDCVYMLLNRIDSSTIENKRMLYVGMTRARSELYIHYNNSAFDNMGYDVSCDMELYPEPNDIIMQLTHKDVVLDFIKNKKDLILKCRSGEPLYLNGHYLYVTYNSKRYPVVKLSSAARQKLDKLYNKGYQVRSAKIRFIAAWRNKEISDTNEYAVVLPEMDLSRSPHDP